MPSFRSLTCSYHQNTQSTQPALPRFPSESALLVYIVQDLEKLDHELTLIKDNHANSVTARVAMFHEAVTAAAIGA